MEDEFYRFRLTLFHAARYRFDGLSYWLPAFQGILRDGRDRWCFLYWFSLGLHIEWTVGSAMKAFQEKIEREDRSRLNLRQP
jgi:predicted metal-dependent phosphoesterase TrpH